jgi:hypothetical protein
VGIGTLGAFDMESCDRFRPATDMSEVAMKPDGVRVVVEPSFARSAAIDRSRRAFALSLLSSCGVLDLRVNFEDGRLTIRRVTSGVGGEIAVERRARRWGGVDCRSIVISSTDRCQVEGVKLSNRRDWRG